MPLNIFKSKKYLPFALAPSVLQTMQFSSRSIDQPECLCCLRIASRIASRFAFVFFILSCTFLPSEPLPVAGEMLNKFENLATKKGDKMGDSKLLDAKNALFIRKNRYINVPV